MISKNRIGLLALVLLALGAGSFALTRRAQPASDGVQDTMVSRPSPNTTTQDVQRELLDIAKTQDPKRALLGLREMIHTDPALLRSCHPLVHEIGRIAYEKYGDFGHAMTYRDEVCNSGYLHGVIEAYFSSSADVFAAMQAVCTPYPLGKFLSWECYHGTGHGVMYYTSNDLPRSLALCERHGRPFARTACANGVFMENFSTDQKLHPSRFLNAHNPLYPCADQAPRHKGDCYLYAPTYYLRLHPDDYVGALAWCLTAESSFQAACAQGVGNQTMKEHIDDPSFVMNVCLRGTPEQITPCIDGMIGLYINHHASLEPARRACAQFDSPYQKTCFRAVEAHAALF